MKKILLIMITYSSLVLFGDDNAHCEPVVFLDLKCPKGYTIYQNNLCQWKCKVEAEQVGIAEPTKAKIRSRN